MKQFLQNPKFKNPIFWTSLVAIIFGAAGISFDTLTSWKLMGEAILGILANPVSVVAVIIAVVGVFNNNDTKGLDKIKIDNTDKAE